jgi:hypothetical protein
LDRELLRKDVLSTRDSEEVLREERVLLDPESGGVAVGFVLSTMSLGDEAKKGLEAIQVLRKPVAQHDVQSEMLWLPLAGLAIVPHGLKELFASVRVGLGKPVADEDYGIRFDDRLSRLLPQLPKALVSLTFFGRTRSRDGHLLVWGVKRKERLISLNEESLFSAGIGDGRLPPVDASMEFQDPGAARRVGVFGMFC